MKKTTIFTLILSTSLVALAACDSLPVDSSGAVSPDVAAQADSVSGNYAGTLAVTSSSSGTSIPVNADFQVRLSLDGNRPVLASNSDLLGEGCGSAIGKLTHLEVGGTWDVIATFELNPGQCADRAEGREVYFYLNRNGNALLALDKDTTTTDGGKHQNHRELRAEMKKL